MDQAKNIKYLPLDARAEWKASDGSSTIRGFESGCQSLEEYSKHTVTMSGDLENVGGLSDVSLITDEYVMMVISLSQYPIQTLISHQTMVIGQTFQMIQTLMRIHSSLMLKSLLYVQIAQ